MYFYMETMVSYVAHVHRCKHMQTQTLQFFFFFKVVGVAGGGGVGGGEGRNQSTSVLRQNLNTKDYLTKSREKKKKKTP